MVNKMNRKLEYALMALKHMVGKAPGELSSVKEIVTATGSPFDATARVMQQMAHRGLLRSEQGVHGGYFIIKDLGRVSFYELMEMILGPVGVVKCLHGDESCELMDRCNIQSPVSVLNRKLIQFYQGVSLAEILRIKEGVHRPEQELRV